MTTTSIDIHALAVELVAKGGLSPSPRLTDDEFEALIAEAESVKADLQHVLTEHRMGADGAQADTDPELADVLAAIKADPTAWHEADHAQHAVPLDADHAKTEWGA